jgi:hypothetical protein
VINDGTVTPLATDNPLGEFEGATETLSTCIPNDYTWLTTAPISGTVPANGVTPVTVTFDTTNLAEGTYTAQLCIRSNDPDGGSGNGSGLVQVPVTLTVEPPTALVLADLAALPGPAWPRLLSTRCADGDSGVGTGSAAGWLLVASLVAVLALRCHLTS